MVPLPKIMAILLGVLWWTACLVTGRLEGQVHAVVAQDGSGNYATIAEAIAAAPSNSATRWNIRIKRGIYFEYLSVGAKKTNLAFIGDGIDKTIISGNRSAKEGLQTYNTATVEILGLDFVAQDITFQNTAGAAKEQAVALRSNVRSAFYRCKFSGYQDSLHNHRGEQFFRECQILGTVDFIFGDAPVVFQNCMILVRLPPPQKNTVTVTAQGREVFDGPSGIVMQNCSITPAEDLRRRGPKLVKAYLGRPWKNYSRTVIMQSFIDDFIQPRGWLEWDRNSTDVGTIYYAEYGNKGPGAATARRVKWTGYHIIDRTKASSFTVRNFINGTDWLPSTGVPFFPDLI